MTAGKIIEVSAALIFHQGRLLITQRPAATHLGGLWEFPGGKLDPGESPEEALIRELKEELGINVRSSCLAPLGFASHDYDRFHLLMPLYACRKWQGNPVPREGQGLAWVGKAKLNDYLVPPADIPLIALLRDWL